MSYTVTEREGCTFIAGRIPVQQLTALMSAGQKGAVLSDHLARLAGVQFAWGLPADVEALEAQLRAEKLAARPDETVQQAARQSKEALRWLVAGELGLSACAIFWRLTGTKPGYIYNEMEFHHPHDAGDLRRCMLLLDQVPELQGHMREMMGCSPEWNALVEQWDTLCAMYKEEIPNWQDPNHVGFAEKTSIAMRDILRDARK